MCSLLFLLVILSLVTLAPYRKDAHNKIDTLIFLVVVSAFPLDYLKSFLWPYSRHFHRIFRVFSSFLSLTPVLYILFLRKVLPRKFQATLKRYCSILTSCRRRSLEQDVEDQGYTHTDLKLKTLYCCHNVLSTVCHPI